MAHRNPTYIEEHHNVFGDHLPWLISIRMVDNGRRVYDFMHLATEAAHLLQDRVVYHVNLNSAVRIPTHRIYDSAEVTLFGSVDADVSAASRYSYNLQS